jgi:hypothetical protein
MPTECVSQIGKMRRTILVEGRCIGLYVNGMTDSFNPYKKDTLQSNWYEERFFHANTRSDTFVERTRPLEDEIEHIPRLTRKAKPESEVFQFRNDTPPEKHYRSISQETYVHHTPNLESITTRRMDTSGEQLQKILSKNPTRYICNHSLPYRGPEKQFKTIYTKSWVRHI